MNKPIRVGLTTGRTLRTIIAVTLLVLAGRAFYAEAQTITILHSFVGSPIEGEHPIAGLVQGSDGNFYGTTQNGGLTNETPFGEGYGTVFRISPSGSYTDLYTFTDPFISGATPWAGLVQGRDGNFYGTTVLTGGEGGTVFRISPSGTHTSLYSFGSPNDGRGPFGGLVQGSDGNFYGTTEDGGNTNNNNGFGFGTIFRISPSGTYTSLYSFVGAPMDGSEPKAGLVQGGDGNFYGTTQFGGTNGVGTVFRVSPSGSYSNLYSFGSIPNDGANPVAGLMHGSDGNFYGTTTDGGTNNNGTVFRMSPSGSYTNLYSFIGSPIDGADPEAGLIQGSDGNFYGTTRSGGTNGAGTVFRISPSGNYSNLYSFGSIPNDGNSPYGGLVQGGDGNFYGTTFSGGTNGAGVVFKLTVPLAGFTGKPTSGLAPLTVTFTDHSAGSITNWFWNFGDGGTTNLATNGVVYTYNNPGSYTVSEIITGPSGVFTCLQPNYITVIPTIPAITKEGYNILVTWTVFGGQSNVLQSTKAAAIASYNTNFTDISPVIFLSGIGGSTTNYLDPGVAYAPILPAPSGNNVTTSTVPSTVDCSGADTRGITDSLGRALPIGTLIMLGSFSISEPTIQSNFFANNVAAIMSNFTPYATSFKVGDGTSLSGSWEVTRSAAGFDGQQIYLLAIDKPTFAAATHLGIYTAPSWVFPSGGGTNTIDLADVTDFVLGAQSGPLTINLPVGGATYTFDDTARLNVLPGRILFYRLRLVQ